MNADRERAMDTANTDPREFLSLEERDNLSRAYIEVVGENERLRGALRELRPATIPDGCSRGAHDMWFVTLSRPDIALDEAYGEYEEYWATVRRCHELNRYEQLTGLRVEGDKP